jgi:hypothetical protein
MKNEEEEELCIDFLNAGDVYMFHPSRSFPSLALTLNRHSVLYLLREKSIILVLKQEGTWRLLNSCGKEGWANVSNDFFKSKNFVNLKNFRRYEIWNGNNKFFCNGFVMLGSDFKYFIIANIALFFIWGTFIIFILNNFSFTIKVTEILLFI